jgi:serine protease Do
MGDTVDVALRSVVQVKAGGRGIGTGVIWRSNSAASELVTNAHVVAGVGKGQLQVTLADGRAYAAELLASQTQLDLALLRIAAGNLPAALVAESSSLRVGEWVFAIGNPWGQVGVVTQGVISATGALTMRDGRKAQYLRSDVQLAPGNSGGPLLNVDGHVIGINAMIFGGDLSVAIPSATVIEWIAGQPDRSVRLGVGVRPVAVPAHGPALLVVNVEVDSPAARALMVGDVLLGVNGERIHDADALVRVVRRGAAGKQALKMAILRGGQAREVPVAV